MTRVCRQVGVVLLVFGLGVPHALAQQTGTLAGVVRDAQGAVLPGVTVTVASPALLGSARTTVTGENRGVSDFRIAAG